LTIITDSEFHSLYRSALLRREEQVDARVGIVWRNVASAPRDGQWFWAKNDKTGAIYHACWCQRRQCFVHTKTNYRVNPTHWDGCMQPLWAYISYPVICSGIFFVFWALHVAAAR